jgi:hypothetical protein
MELLSPIISLIALCISLFTAWFTILRRGTVRSTRPSFIAFRYDFVGKLHPQAKIFLRALLYSTGKRGIVIESLFLRVREGERSEEFSFWGHGDKELVRGSGLFVGENGLVTNHHFNPINSETLFQFTAGVYDLELVAKLVNRDRLVTLSKLSVNLPEGAFDLQVSPDTAVFLNWSPEENCYVGSIERRDEGLLLQRQTRS